MKQQHVSITIAARVGHSPIYPRLGQGLLGGTIVSVRQGDSEVAHSRLDELEHVFGTEFDRGELTVDNLRPVLWAAHWLKAVRPVAQRASELLTLAAVRAFEPGSKAARDCDAIARVMAGVATTEPHCLTALEASRKIRVPADFYAGERLGLGEDIATSALRADGIRAVCDLSVEDSREISRRTRDAYVGALGLPKGMPASHPDNCPDCNAIPTSSHGCGRDGIHQAGQTYDDSPFRIYGFAHEMLEVLQRINIKVAGRDAVYSHGLQPSEQMLADADSAMEAVWVLLDKIAGRGPMEADPQVETSQAAMIAEAAELQAARDQAEAIVEIADEQRAMVARIESQRRGLMALAAYIGETCTSRVLSAMERPA